MAEVLSGKRLQTLSFIADNQRDRGYPPSVREIGEAVGLTSSATVHTHLAVLQREGYLSRDPSKPRAIQVHFDPDTESKLPPAAVHNVPLVGDVAAGTGVLAEENVEERLPMPEQFIGTGSGVHAAGARGLHGRCRHLRRGLRRGARAARGRTTGTWWPASATTKRP